MSWEHFIWFAIAALICWSLGAFAAWKGKKPVWTYVRGEKRSVSICGQPEKA